MIRLGALLAGIIGLIFFWYECGEDFAVLCYRIGLGALRACACARSFRCP